MSSRWQAGKSANPGGRPKAVQGASARLSRMIDESTQGGKLLHEALLEFVFGNPAKGVKPIDRTSPQWARIWLEAFGMLMDRWAGKPTQHVEVEDVTDPAALVDAALASLPPALVAALDQALDGAEADDVPGL